MNFSRFIIIRHPFFLLLLLTWPCIRAHSAIHNSDTAIPFSYTTHLTSPSTSTAFNIIAPIGSGKLLLGNERNLWIFDGKYWEHLPTVGCIKVAIKSSSEILVADSLGIFNVWLTERGFIEIDTVLSIKELNDPAEISAISYNSNGLVFFTTHKKVWEISNKPKLIYSSENEVTLFGNSYGNFFYSENQGFFNLEKPGNEPILKPNALLGNKIINIFNVKNDLVVVQSSYPWVSIIDNGKLKQVGNISKLFQPSLFEINSAVYQNGELYLLTNREGLIITDEEGGYKTRIVSNSTVNLEQITSFFPPSVQQVIALSGAGIHKITRPEVAGQYSKIINLQARPNHFLFNGYLVYCAHSEGLLFAELEPNKPQNIAFKEIKGINEEIIKLEKQLGFTVAYGKANVYYIKNLRIDRVEKNTIPQNTSEIIDNIFEYHLQSNYLYTEVSYRIDGNDSLYLIKRIHKDYPDQNPLWLAKRNRNKAVEPIRFVGTIPAIETVRQVNIALDSSIWIVTSDGLKYFSQIKSSSKPKPNISIQSIGYKSKSNQILLRVGYLASNNRVTQEKHKSPVSNLTINLSSFNHSNTSLTTDLVFFSTFIEGIDTAWTRWSPLRTREIGRLKHGTYAIKAKAMNLAGEESEITSFEFTILPRFYETKLAYIAFIILSIVGAYMVLNWRAYIHAKVRFKLESLINKRTEELVKEKEKTDNLLARVLPHDTASELKEKGKVNTQRFKMVTVLFSDIEGFTRITDETNPETLIDQLDKFFLYFDSVVEKYRIEKIKTIGDAYMCAGGIPEKNRTNPIEVILAALEMMQYMKSITSSSSQKSKVWELRIGVDTGPVIAGVVGRSKLTYDIWGSTVNTASRMESSGETGQINISGNTYMLVKDYFICTFRGKMPVKNKGDIQMYFVNGIKPSLSEGMQGLKPNYDFFIQLQLIRLGDLEDFILEKLEKGLPKNLYYHNLKHTVDVYTQVELIGRSENVTKEEMLLLRTAALFHDAGHLIDYDTHEEMAVKLVREILPEYQYSEKQIDIISQLIMVTKLPPQPKNLLEEIICDADLDYLGRPDFLPVSNMLYKELHEHGKIGTQREWNELQIKFIDKHHYFTKTARRLRNVNKQSQLDKLKIWMENN